MVDEERFVGFGANMEKFIFVWNGLTKERYVGFGGEKLEDAFVSENDWKRAKHASSQV